MKIASVNISRIQTVPWRGVEVSTGIYKEPVNHKVWVHQLCIDGDEQADLTVHGGEAKAVYAYSLENYAWWSENWQATKLSPGAFGENLTIANFDEDNVYLGDIYQIGEAVLQTTQPQFPCYKLGIKFGNQEIIKQFMVSRRLGVYFRVLKEGFIEQGNVVKRLEEDPHRIPVKDLAYLFSDKKFTIDDIKKVLKVESLEEDWRLRIIEKLRKG